MQINDKPFSIYDFIGYLIPGIFAFYASIFIYNYKIHETIDISIFQDNKLDEEKIFAVIFFYVAGHLLNFFSSMSVEKYSLWTLGYPSMYLFNKATKKGYFKGCWKIEKEHFKGSLSRSIVRCIIRFDVLMILFPVALGDFIIRKLFRLHDTYARPFEDSLLRIIEDNNSKIINEFYKDNSINTEGDTFRLIYHYAIEHSSNHVSKMQNYVALYGFTRTLTFIGCILFWEWLSLDIYKFSILGIHLFFINFFTWGNILVVFLIFFFTFFLYWDFNKFYRKFSMEAYLGAVVAMNKE